MNTRLTTEYSGVKAYAATRKKHEHFPSFEEETRSAALKLRILS